MQLKDDEVVALSEFINQLRKVEKYGSIWTFLQVCGYDLYKNQTGYDSSTPSILSSLKQNIKQDITRILFNYYTGMGNLCNSQDTAPYLKLVSMNTKKMGICTSLDVILFDITTKVLDTFSSLKMAIDGSMYPYITFIVPNSETYISNKIIFDGSYLKNRNMLLLNIDEYMIQKQFNANARTSDIARQIISNILGDILLDANVQVFDGLHIEAIVKLS